MIVIDGTRYDLQRDGLQEIVDSDGPFAPYAHALLEADESTGD